MRETTYFCDRCDRKLTGEGAVENYRYSIIFNGTRSVDLCRPCWVAFETWKDNVDE